MGCEFSAEDKVNNFLYITANVGSLFENLEEIEKVWTGAFSEIVNKYEPDFIALHCQEIGGKCYANSKEDVIKFVKRLSICESLKCYTIQRVYIDTDYKHAEQYTALGNFYFVHNKVNNIKLYNFKKKEYKLLNDKNFYFDELDSLHEIQKEKFPQDFFPEFRWSRKGYIRTRWKIGNRIIELINIHLFHDENNLLSFNQSPSSYSAYRKRALNFVIDKLTTGEDICKNGIFFLFGDLNFRLELKSVVEKILPEASKEIVEDENNPVKVVYTDISYKGTLSTNESKYLLVLQKKLFQVQRDIITENDKYDHLLEFDKELLSYQQLNEFRINFSPTYPYSEEVNDPNKFMNTRCPAWCDRVLFSPQSLELLKSDKCVGDIVYGRVGDKVCMGDHKPVFLSFSLKSST